MEQEEIDDIKSQIETLEEEIDELEEKLENLENEDEYDEMLNDCYGTFKIGYIEFDASRILKELDEIAYNCGMSEYFDEQQSELETEIEEKKSEIKELKEQLKGVD